MKTVRNIEKGDTVGQADSIDKIVRSLLVVDEEINPDPTVSPLIPKPDVPVALGWVLAVRYDDGREAHFHVPDADILDDLVQRFMHREGVREVEAEPAFHIGMRSDYALAADKSEDPDEDENPEGEPR